MGGLVDLLASVFRGLIALVLWLWGARDQLRVVVLGFTLVVAVSNLYFLKKLGQDPEGYTCGRKSPHSSRGSSPCASKSDSACSTLGDHGTPGEPESVERESPPLVSVLVPARNEELNVEDCVTSLLAQEYPDFEVLVLDDHSTDNTPIILSRLQRSDRRLQVFKGQPLPEGWLGKHWACHQLSLAARGELLLFTDADTRHHPLMLRDAVAVQQQEASDLMTGLPREEAVSWGERLVVPIIGWSVLALLPVGLAHRLKNALFCMGIGQFMLFRRAAFWAVGGFAGVRSDPVDDMALARRVKSMGLRWRLVDLTSRVSCRMYRGFREAADGLGKSVFPALGGRLWVLGLLCLLLAWLYLAPLGAWSGWVFGLLPGEGPPFWAGVAVVLAFASWALTMWRFGQPVRRALLYPMIVACVLGISVRSALQFRRGEASWKGRTLPGVCAKRRSRRALSDGGRKPE